MIPSNFTQAMVEKFVTSSDGVQIYATAAGKSHLPALVLIHGLSLSALVFAQLMQNKDLLASFYLVAYDTRGHGRSGKPNTIEGHSSKLYADDFAAVVKGFNLDSPILLGWSLGATVAADVFSHLGPNAISGIIYVAPVPHTGPIIGEISQPRISSEIIPGFLSQDNVTAPLTARIDFAQSFFTNPDKIPTATKWAWIGSSVFISVDVFELVISREQNTTSLFEAGKAGFPALLITGERDQDIQSDVVTGILKDMFPELISHDIPDGSHALFYEFEGEFVAQVVKFATRVFKNRHH